MFLIFTIGEVHFNVLENRICHLSAARREKGHKMLLFWSVKSRIGEGKVREILLALLLATLSERPAD